MTHFQNLAAPAGRFFLSLIFIISGLQKVSSYSGTQGYMEAMGVPGALLPAVIAVEIIGGLAILLGWRTRVAAFLLAGFSLLSAVLFHANFGDQMQTIMFLKNVSIAGGLLMLVPLGAGAFSIDNRQTQS